MNKTIIHFKKKLKIVRKFYNLDKFRKLYIALQGKIIILLN